MITTITLYGIYDDSKVEEHCNFFETVSKILEVVNHIHEVIIIGF